MSNYSLMWMDDKGLWKQPSSTQKVSIKSIQDIYERWMIDVPYKIRGLRLIQDNKTLNEWYPSSDGWITYNLSDQINSTTLVASTFTGKPTLEI